MKKGFFRLSGAAVVLFLLAMVVACVRSHFAWDSVWVRRTDVAARDGHDHGFLWDEYAITSTDGSLCIHFDEDEDRNVAGWDSEGDAIPMVPSPPSTKVGWSSTLPGHIHYEPSSSGWRIQVAGLAMGVESYQGTGGGSDVEYLIVPYWLPIVISGAVSSIYLLRRRQYKLRLRRGLCPTCGYDLCVTPDRCPECGMIPRPC